MKKRIVLTGGIACGKSLVAKYLNELGVATIDADDIVHELVPEEERKRLAKIVFNDPAARKALEAKLHPVVKERIRAFLESRPESEIALAIVPLLHEVQWERNFDIICCVKSEKARQVLRMMTTRGYTREEAEARLAAQMPVADKAAKSHYVIDNNGSAEELKSQVVAFLDWLKVQRQQEEIR